MLFATCLVVAGCTELRGLDDPEGDAAVNEDGGGTGGTFSAGSGGQGSGGIRATPGSGGASSGSGGLAASSGGASGLGSGGAPRAASGGSSASGTGGVSAGTGGSVPSASGGSTASGGATPGTGGKAGTGGTVAGTGGTVAGTGGMVAGTGGMTAPAPVTCTGPNHLCLGKCVANSAVANCGASCDPCTAPSGGTVTCDGSKCDFTCGSMKKCGSKCVPSDGCCADSDCPAQNGTARQCDTASNTCKASGCATGFKPCNNMCIANAACCSNNDCGGTCKTCSGPGGSCVDVKNADDTDSCAGTCDGSGVCKSKRGQTCNTVSGGCIGGSSCAPDGYCCDTACTGSCQACDIKGMQGTCTPVASGAPHGNRAACNSDGSTCGGSCTGKADGTCNYPTGSCGSGPMCSGTNMSVGQSTCSAGSCQKPAAKTCPNSLICSGTACKTSCSANSDCVGGLVCNGGTCATKVVMTGQKTLEADTALSGRVQSDGVIDPRVSVGDYADNVDSCGFISFPLASALIPAGATVTNADLIVYQQSVTGAPYKDLGGKLVVDDTSYTALSLSAYKAAFASPVGISSDATTGMKKIAVTAWVATDVTKGTANSQFRLCFPQRTDGNADQDFVLIPTGGTNKPTLIVDYQY